MGAGLDMAAVPMADLPPSVAALMNAASVRARASEMLRLAREDRLLAWRLDETRLDPCADYVVETIRQNYPGLDIPFHARWRHFTAAGRDLWSELDAATAWPDAEARLAAAFDLAIVSVLLDAGAGPDWRFREPVTGLAIGRSEGLGLASLAMFREGLFSAVPGAPLRVDGRALSRLDEAALARGFQAGPGNPMVGLSGRAGILRALGARLGQLGGEGSLAGRPGQIAGWALARARRDRFVEAASLLEDVLALMHGVWPDRPGAVPGGGDMWRHPLIGGEGEARGAVPFHKLSQWLSYSLIEPLQAAGVAVTDIDGLTGLPEYRNGGLLMDTGVVVLRDPADAARPHDVGSVLVVEWRALTVALLDALADRVRARLGRDAQSMPLARVLEGGTWSAGRRIARERRDGGGPPLAIVSDGTVF